MTANLADLTRDLRARYDAEAAHYDQSRFGDRRGALARRIKDRVLLEQLTRCGVLRPDARILDVATGTGRVLEALRMSPAQLCGIDISPGMLRCCRARIADRAHLAQADMKQMAFADATFDAAVLGSFLYLVPAAAYQAFTSDLARVLKPGAVLLCEVANSRTAFNPRNYWRIARHRRQHAVKSYVATDELAALLPAFACEAIVGVEYPIWLGERWSRWIGKMPVLRALGGKYVALLRRR